MPTPATQPVVWREVSSHYHQLQVATIRISKVTANGGSIAALGSNILIASPQGRFSYLDAQYRLHALPLRTRMNIEGLRNDPLYDDPRFQVASLRTHDLLVIRTAADRYELYASFDRFSGDCIDFVVSRIPLRVDNGEIEAEGRWTDVWVADPCLRFKDRGSLLEGWQQGGRMVQASADTILVSIGDYQRDGFYDSAAVSMDPAYDHGKLIELNVRTGTARRVTIGLRNPQGLTIDGQGRIWETEHGPQGGDEINLLIFGRNYGWPVATFGMNYGSPPTRWRYSGSVEPPGALERPRFAFVPSIGISNLVAPDGGEFPNWADSLVVCSLRGRSLYIVKLQGADVVLVEPIGMKYRLRDIAVLSSGRLAVLADGGLLFLVRNAERAADAEREFLVSGLSSLPPPPEEEAPGAGLTPAQRGKAYFAGSCGGCHSTSGEIRTGPPLDGVVNRAVASVAGFGYSKGLAGMGGVWTERRLANFIHYPDSIAPGTTMPAPGLHDLEANDVVAYLKTLRGGQARGSRE
jgi:cytochrome c2